MKPKVSMMVIPQITNKEVSNSTIVSPPLFEEGYKKDIIKNGKSPENLFGIFISNGVYIKTSPLCEQERGRGSSFLMSHN